MTETLRGADVVVAALKAAGVDVIFTLSGNHIMVLYDALFGSGISLIHVRHEAAAVHMADAYARLTGRVGVALVTGGQGHTNAAAALPTAVAADAPVLLLSGHAPLREVGRGAFQEMPQVDFARSVTKASMLVTSPSDLAQDVLAAISLAISGRTGPVHLSLPTDILEGQASAAIDRARAKRMEQPPRQDEVGRLLDALRDASRPIVLAGPCFANVRGRDLLRAFEDKTGIPAVVMESPRGLADPSLGDFASSLRLADLVVLLAKPHDFTIRFGQSPFVADSAKFVVVEQDEALVERARREQGNRLIGVVVADAECVVSEAMQGLPTSARDGGWLADVRKAVAYRPEAHAMATGGDGQLHPMDLCRAIQKVLDDHPDAILVCDGGEIGQWAQAGISARRRLINGVAGSIGSAIPFALAARVVEKSAPIVAVLGDGTFGFHMAEIDTAVRYGLPVVLVVGNDARWNAEHQIQLRDYGRERAHACTLLPARYDLVAVALGGHGELVTKADELQPAIERALSSKKPACINVMIDGLPAPVVRRH